MKKVIILIMSFIFIFMTGCIAKKAEPDRSALSKDGLTLIITDFAKADDDVIAKDKKGIVYMMQVGKYIIDLPVYKGKDPLEDGYEKTLADLHIDGMTEKINVDGHTGYLKIENNENDTSNIKYIFPGTVKNKVTEVTVEYPSPDNDSGIDKFISFVNSIRFDSSFEEISHEEIVQSRPIEKYIDTFIVPESSKRTGVLLDSDYDGKVSGYTYEDTENNFEYNIMLNGDKPGKGDHTDWKDLKKRNGYDTASYKEEKEKYIIRYKKIDEGYLIIKLKASGHSNAESMKMLNTIADNITVSENVK